MSKEIIRTINGLDYDKAVKENMIDIIGLIDDFVNKEITLEKALAWDEEKVKLKDGNVVLPSGMDEVYRKIKEELGIYGLSIPEQYGGAGLPYTTMVAAVELFSMREPGIAVQLAVHESCVDSIEMIGTESLKEKYLPQLATGDKLGAIVFTEPMAGSDVGAGVSTAKLEGDFYSLNGTKIFITGAGLSTVYFMSAVTDPSASKSKRLSTFILDLEESEDGHSIVRLEDKVVLRTSPTGEIYFENCKVPKENLLGAEGKGLANLLTVLNDGRIEIAAQAVGIAQGAFDLALKYAAEREQFNTKIINFQGIQFDIADMATKIAAARQLVYYAAWYKDHTESCINNPELIEVCSKAKLYASQISSFVCNKALEIFGGYGICNEYHVERYFRNAKITEIYEGTSNIQKLSIARIFADKAKEMVQ